MDLTEKVMRQALKELDGLLDRPLKLIVGGGGALLLAHQYPLATSDIDAFPKGLTSDELGGLVKQVALKLSIPGDWLNPWFSSFTHVLPADYESRLIEFFKGSNLTAVALGAEDLLLMKCFAHRQKDVPHARALIRKGADVEMVMDRIEELQKAKIPHSKEAMKFLEDMLDLEDV